MVAAFSRLVVPLDTQPMEARLVDAIPSGEGWQYEPKWDGFRCLAFRDGDDVALMSKSGKPLARYFPEVAELLRRCRSDRFVVDGELILPLGDSLSFDALQVRLHPAASRIERLARETPAQLMLFDCLQSGAKVLMGQPLTNRRAALEALMAEPPAGLLLSPATRDCEVADDWLARSGGALDGIIAKRLDGTYQRGERAMAKRKLRRSADCVLGGFRYDTAGRTVASLLLGLYDEAGLLHHVGYTSALSAEARAALTPELEALKGPSAFTGSAPGGPSRWSSGRSSEWQPLRAERVVEVGYDQVTGGRFRHGTTFVRWRPDKMPSQCTCDQLAAELRPEQLEQVLGIRPS